MEQTLNFDFKTHPEIKLLHEFTARGKVNLVSSNKPPKYWLLLLYILNTFFSLN